MDPEKQPEFSPEKLKLFTTYLPNDPCKQQLLADYLANRMEILRGLKDEEKVKQLRIFLDGFLSTAEKRSIISMIGENDAVDDSNKPKTRTSFWRSQMRRALIRCKSSGFSLEDLFLAASFLLPKKTRNEAFEPAYNDAKADFLKAQTQCKSTIVKKRLAVCFAAAVMLMIVQCFYGMCIEKAKRLSAKRLS